MFHLTNPSLIFSFVCLLRGGCLGDKVVPHNHGSKSKCSLVLLSSLCWQTRWCAGSCQDLRCVLCYALSFCLLWTLKHERLGSSFCENLYLSLIFSSRINWFIYNIILPSTYTGEEWGDSMVQLSWVVRRPWIIFQLLVRWKQTFTQIHEIMVGTIIVEGEFWYVNYIVFLRFSS